jgi:hypothetical protein
VRRCLHHETTAPRLGRPVPSTQPANCPTPAPRLAAAPGVPRPRDRHVRLRPEGRAVEHAWHTLDPGGTYPM